MKNTVHEITHQDTISLVTILNKLYSRYLSCCFLKNNTTFFCRINDIIFCLL